MNLLKQSEIYAPAEPFDERLLLLRFLKNLWKLLAVTLIGTLVFGGAYCLKNIVFGEKPFFEAKSYYQIYYQTEVTKETDYYVNYFTWNIYIHSDVVTDGVLKKLENEGIRLSKEELIELTEADVESDLTVLCVTAHAGDAGLAAAVAAAMEQELTVNFSGVSSAIREIAVIDHAKTSLVKPDVRPVRAFLLAAILTGFFATVIYLLWETGTDSLYLPSTLTKRYGLKTLGTEDSEELDANLLYLFGEAKTPAFVTSDAEMNPLEFLENWKREAAGKENSERIEEILGRMIVVPSPVICEEAFEKLRECDSVLLAVPAGSRSGKPLEKLLEALETQDVKVTAALLWNADEKLIRNYYRISGKN